LLVALSGVFVISGCSNGKKGFVLKGSVSYQGKPLSSGMVRLYMPDNRMAMAMIRPDGSFEATDVFAGETKLTIEEDPAVKQLMPAPAGAQKALAPKASAAPPVPIPPKYKDVSTSGLVFTVTSAKQRLDIELE
jgi:hypothetical protein